MLDILKRIQTDVSGLKTDVSGLKADMVEVKGRLEQLETASKKQSRDSAAMLIVMRGTVGAFDERGGKLEDEIRLIREQE